jgi:integrase
MGSIYKPKWKDKDGTVRESAVWWIKYYRAGKPYRESTKSTKESDARRLLKKREGEISEGKLPGIYFDKVRWDELAEDYLINFRLENRKSMVRAEIVLEHLKGHFSGMRVTEITSATVDRYIERRLAEEMANGTVNRELAVLRAALVLGARQTPPKVDRVPFIRTLGEGKPRQGFFEHGEYLRLLDALPEYLRPVFTFAYHTGWRRGEILGLTWAQVDREAGIVRLEPGTTKNDQARTIYLDGELRAVIEEQWQRRVRLGSALPWVFLNAAGTAAIGANFTGVWKRACKAAGCPARVFHDLRRTACRNMVRSGIPERVAMLVSGHLTRSIFDRYNIVSDADLKQAAAKQEAYLETVTGTNTGKVTPLKHSKTRAKSASTAPR